MKRLLALVLVSSLFAGTVYLGFWQLERAAQKVAAEKAATEQQELPIAMLEAATNLATIQAYRQVSIQGDFIDQYQVLLDNKVMDGRVGYEVLTPFRIKGSDSVVLVNRGWVPLQGDRSILPNIHIAATNVEITGRVRVPSTFFTLKEQQFTTLEWEPVWQNLDLATYDQLTPFSAAPFYVELDEQADYGFTRRWLSGDDHWIERHRGYAIQWFGLGLTLLVLSFYLFMKNRRQVRDEDLEK